MTFIGIPLIVLGVAWVISGAVFFLIGSTVPGGDAMDLRDASRNSWAVLSPVWYLISAGALAFAGTFPFALGMGSTRRDFHFGTTILFVLVSAGFSLFLTVMAAVERATSGWGINNWMFNGVWIGLDSVFVDFYSLFVVHLLALFTGAAAATLWFRWKALGVIGFIAVCSAALIGGLAAIGYSDAGWEGFFMWASTLGFAGMFTLLLIPVGVMFLVSFIMNRFATPKQ
jgi:hypothetical protein